MTVSAGARADAAAPRVRLGLLLWMAGMSGVIVLTVLFLPAMLAEAPLPLPLEIVSLLSIAQSGVLLAIAVWAGTALAPRVALGAPAFEAVVAGRPVVRALRPQLRPGLIAGVVGGLLLFVVARQAPAALAAVQERFAIPLAARVLYGGITEELLLRWGVMTALVWLGWRFLQRRQGVVRPGYVWLAIGLSALLFGAGHLPAAAVLTGGLTPEIVSFVLVANTAFGVLFGFLFWRYGLEAAIIAHAFAHVVAWTLLRIA